MKSRLVWIDSLRIISIWGTILIHVSAQGWRESEALRWQFSLWQILVHFCVPVFFMLSGTMMLQNIKESNSPGLYIKTHIFHLVKIYVFWNSLYALAALWGTGKVNIHAALKIATEGHYHLWFLWALVGLYIITPLLDFAYDKKKCQLFILLFAVFGIFLNYGVSVLKIPFLIQINQQIVFSFATQYVGYYVLGYYLYRWPPSYYQRLLLQIMGIIAVCLCEIITLWDSIRTGQTQTQHAQYLAPYTFFISISVYVTAQQASAFLERRKWISLVAWAVQGIYVIHDLVFRAIGVQRLGAFYDDVLPLISVPMVTTIVFLICFIICLVIKKISFLKGFL